MWSLRRRGRSTCTNRLPDDGELLAYLDGELPPGRRAEVEAMIGRSWEARARLAGIQRDVETYVRSAARPVPALPPVEVSWAKLLARTGASPAAVPRRIDWRLAAGAVAAGLFLVAIFRLASPPPISAGEVIARALTAERKAIEGVDGPVVHQRLRITRTRPGKAGVEQAVWELWRPAGAEHIRERVGLPGGPVLEPAEAGSAERLHTAAKGALAQAGFDPARPLSASGYNAWRRRSAVTEESVERRTLPDGGKALTIRATTAGALAADLTVRTDSWRPVSQRLVRQTPEGADEVEIAEASFRVVPLASLGGSFFARTGIETPRAARPPLPPPFVEIAPVNPLPEALPIPARESIRTTIDALFALHRAGICESGRVSLGRDSSGRVTIRGALESGQRREMLLAALAHLPGADIDVTVQPAEPASQPSPDARGVAEALLRHPEAPAGGRPAAAWSAAALVDAILADCRALRRLEELLSDEDLAAAPFSSRWLLQQVAREHLTGLRRNATTLGELLRPHLPASSEGPAVEPLHGGAAWSGNFASLERQARDLAAALSSLPGGADPALPLALAERLKQGARLADAAVAARLAAPSESRDR